jgi:ParB-like chromosome segregation protein Spo0J
MKIDHLPIGTLRLNPANPRQIGHKEFASLVRSLKECPEMFEARPLLVSNRTGENVVLGGNMRLRAAQQLGYTEVPAIILPGLTEAQEREIVIKDNGAWGEWDWDKLANEWDDVPLADWGVSMPSYWLDNPESKGGECEMVTCPTCGRKHKKDDE